MKRILFCSFICTFFGCLKAPNIPIHATKINTAVVCTVVGPTPQKDPACVIYTGTKQAIDNQVLTQLTAHGSGPYQLSLGPNEAAQCINTKVIENGKFKICSMRYQSDFQ